MKFGIVLRLVVICAAFLYLSGCDCCFDNKVLVTDTDSNETYLRRIPRDYVFVKGEYADTNGFSTTTIYFKRKEK